LLAGDALIWLLDEPYNGLDQANVARLDAALSRHTEQGGIALVASHIAPTVNVTRSLVIDRPRAEMAA
jgi:heme exporter protein A